MTSEREAIVDEEDFSFLKLRKMNRIEKRIRRWWMQRQLWNAYKKAATLLWARYEASLEKDGVDSDSLFQQTLYFRLRYEKERDMINEVFETKPRETEWMKENN